MRIWDLPAGYLNRQSLLGEHRELHGIHSILTNGKSGYARHPETLRWTKALSGLAVRHRQLAAEMRLRGYTDRTPLRSATSKATWPASFVTEPAEQVALLRGKYVGKEKGRIPLPRSPQELWAHHKLLRHGPQSSGLPGTRSRGRAHATWSGFINALPGADLDPARPTEPRSPDQCRRAHVGTRRRPRNRGREGSRTIERRAVAGLHSTAGTAPSREIPAIVDGTVRAGGVRRDGLRG